MNSCSEYYFISLSVVSRSILEDLNKFSIKYRVSFIAWFSDSMLAILMGKRGWVGVLNYYAELMSSSYRYCITLSSFRWEFWLAEI